MAKREMIVLAALAGAAACCGSAGGAALTLMAQTRSVQAHAVADSEADDDAASAPAFDPFLGHADSAAMTDQSAAESSAAQDSSMLSGTISATGNASGLSDINTINPGVCSSSASSDFSVTFEITTPCAYALTGRVESALSRPGGPSADARVRLERTLAEVLDRRALLDPIGLAGTFASIDLDEHGVLPPGVYTLSARAATTTVASPEKNAGAVFQLVFSISDAPLCPADIDGDRLVNSTDLQFLLGKWGTSLRAADLNGDGVINSSDLGLLLGAWGSCDPK